MMAELIEFGFECLFDLLGWNTDEEDEPGDRTGDPREPVARALYHEAPPPAAPLSPIRGSDA